MQKDPSTFTNTTMKQKSQKISANLKICPFMTLRPLPKCLSMSTCVIHSTPLHFTPLRHTSMLDKRALKTYIYIYMYNKSSQQQQRHLSVITPICFSFRVRKPPSYFSGMFWCIILRQIKFSNWFYFTYTPLHTYIPYTLMSTFCLRVNFIYERANKTKTKLNYNNKYNKSINTQKIGGSKSAGRYSITTAVVRYCKCGRCGAQCSLEVYKWQQRAKTAKIITLFTPNETVIKRKRW